MTADPLIGEAPRPGQPGFKPTPEQLRKMQEGRRQKEQTKKATQARSETRKKSRPSGEREPRRPSVGSVTDRARAKCIDLVAEVLGMGESATYFVIHRTAVPADKYDIDHLEQWETRALSEALVDELLRYERTRRLLLQLVDFRARSTLPVVISVIAMGRMLNHGMVPEEFAQIAQTMRDTAKKEWSRGLRREVVDTTAQPASNGTGPAVEPGTTAPEPTPVFVPPVD